ncbi:predicted protein [Plenodomus lingam JN3]|uniref:Uncharacterized protein n=1 Tax=Leptosphaeria maculans (strain JN3 / isolate v23.1.3 / race Av1-4-5-6-7-8) TaxID=985895 RepID=M1ZIL1_LEPMJ|nr:predicted protein [Plenodomus lingam JN3]
MATTTKASPGEGAEATSEALEVIRKPFDTSDSPVWVRLLSQGRRRWCVVDVGGEGDVEGLARKVAIPTLVLRALPNPAGSPIITPPTTPEHHVCTSSEHAGSTRGPGITPCISHQPRRTWCRCPRLFLQMALGRWYYHSFRTSPSILTAPVKARQHREQLQYPPCSSSDVVGSMPRNTPELHTSLSEDQQPMYIHPRTHASAGLLRNGTGHKKLLPTLRNNNRLPNENAEQQGLGKNDQDAESMAPVEGAAQYNLSPLHYKGSGFVVVVQTKCGAHRILYPCCLSGCKTSGETR